MLCGPVRTTSVRQVCWPKMTNDTKIYNFYGFFECYAEGENILSKYGLRLLQGEKGK